MGNSTTQRVNSPPFSISVTGYLTGFYKHKSTFVPKHSSAVGGLAVIFHETIPFNSNSDCIVFPPPLTAIQLLYSAPGELWNWHYPKPRGFPATHDEISIPTRRDDVIRSGEFTCTVSIKEGYSKVIHLYDDTVIDCHPIHQSMVAAALSVDNHRHAIDDHLSDEG